MKTVLYVTLIGGILLCLSPVGVLMWVSWFADLHGCQIDENATHPCVVDGRDLAPTLAGFSLVGWLLIVSLPLAGLLAILLAALGLFDLIRHLRARR